MNTSRIADLNPPLGEPGGPCHVVRRIDRSVPNPTLKEHLTDQVQHGVDLSNPEASKVYAPIMENGVGFISSIKITSHAQYRMDLRGITVEDVQKAVGTLASAVERWKADGSPKAREFLTKFAMGDKIEWLVTATSLKVILQPTGKGTVALVSAFWKGKPDPVPVSVCERVASRYLLSLNKR